ncbi:MAG: polyphosphate kinase 1 [Candidatus Omnitrophica bacterium]|nr:polyphosphate kinase 1 [Candidatus Omnitrophota bacterium]
MVDYQSLSAEEKFIPRDLSWLAFNERVLAEAAEEGNPLLERLKFVGIFVNNLAEFFMVRVAGLVQLLDTGYNQKNAVGYYPQDLYRQIKERADHLQGKLYALYQGALTAALAINRVSIKAYPELNPEQKKFVRRYFESTLFPIVTPLAVDQGRPFPLLSSKTVAFAVTISREGTIYLAVVPVPRSVPRLVKIPSGAEEYCFILVDEILRHNLEKFFKGYKVQSQASFRILRNSEFSLDEEETADLLDAIENELRKRARGKIVALEIGSEAGDQMREMLCHGLGFNPEYISRVEGPLDLAYVFELIAQVPLPYLQYQQFLPAQRQYGCIFEAIKESVFMQHLPYQSFQPTVDLIAQAARDPDVLAIKMTLYRTGEGSAIINALKEAAENNKQVTVLVEIKARFDEELNIQWVRELEESGCHVMYGLAGMKVHAKMALIVRREEGRIRRYVHMSTGNYNEKTAQVYTDIGYFTCNDDFAQDISDMFNVITGYSLPPPWRRIVSSPYDLRQYFFGLIDKEIEYQQQNGNGLIMAQMNSLEDLRMIEKLYEASGAGVKIYLVVRGICCLIPGVAGMSENIQVKSVVGRFLEHSRIFIFNNNDNARVFLSSADWMRRNLERRIEMLFEIYNDTIKNQLREIVNLYWQDTEKSWFLQPDRSYCRARVDTEPFSAQDYFMNYYSG